MTRNPVLVEAVTRAWGLDDPRVCTSLRAENQPGRYRRTLAVEGRAGAAGWPPMLVDESLKASTRAVRRLEGIDFHWNGTYQLPATIYDE